MSSGADERLQRLRTAVATLPDAPGRTACPPSDRIWEATHGRLSPDELDPLVAHSLRCAACSFAFRLSRELLADAHASPARIASRRRPWTIVAAASVAAAAALAVFALRPPAREPTETRGTDRDLVRSLTPASIVRTDAVLRWTPAGEGARYTVVVSRLDLTPLYRAEGLEAPEVKVPAEALAGAAPGEQILWRVEARLPDGREVDSASFVIRLE